MRSSGSAVLLAALTAAAWGVILFVPEALFWDDWLIPAGDVIGLYRDLGLPWMGPVATALAAAGQGAFKIVAVISAVVIALSARAIASRGLGFDRVQSWIAAALVALLPFNIARAGSAVLLTYSVSLALFFVAWWLLVAPGAHARVRQAAAAVLFLASFTTASLLPFIAVPVAHLALLEFDRTRRFLPWMLRFAGRHWPVLASPIVFWVLRTLFLQPSGLYAGYNEFEPWAWPPTTPLLGILVAGALGAAGVLLLLWRLAARTRSGRRDTVTIAVAGTGAVAAAITLWVGRGSLTPGSFAIPVLLALAGAALVLIAVWIRIPDDDARSLAAISSSAGLVVLALGALPYLLVGKVPSFMDWETRHQLLLPVGVALLMVSAVAAFDAAGRRTIARVAGGAAVAISAVVVATGGFALVADWHKQQQVIAALNDLDDVRSASTVVIDDTTTSWNYGARAYRFYEPIGWLRAAYGGDSRLAIAAADVPAAESGGLAPLLAEGVRYGFREWDPTGPAVDLVIAPRDGATWWDLLLGRPAVTVTSSPGSVDLGG